MLFKFDFPSEEYKDVADEVFFSSTHTSIFGRVVRIVEHEARRVEIANRGTEAILCNDLDGYDTAIKDWEKIQNTYSFRWHIIAMIDDGSSLFGSDNCAERPPPSSSEQLLEYWISEIKFSQMRTVVVVSKVIKNGSYLYDSGINGRRALVAAVKRVMDGADGGVGDAAERILLDYE